MNIVKKIKKKLSSLGPGSVVAAAFIGPGTITMCSISGAQFGYSLVWALIISILITLVIQSTVVRISIVSTKPTTSSLGTYSFRFFISLSTYPNFSKSSVDKK